MIRKLRNVSTLLAQINTFQTVDSQKTSCAMFRLFCHLQAQKNAFIKIYAAFVLI